MLETSIGAVSRIKTFTGKTESEALTGETAPLPANWPMQGSIEFKNVIASYKSVFRFTPGSLYTPGFEILTQSTC